MSCSWSSLISISLAERAPGKTQNGSAALAFQLAIDSCMNERVTTPAPESPCCTTCVFGHSRATCAAHRSEPYDPAEHPVTSATLGGVRSASKSQSSAERAFTAPRWRMNSAAS